MGFSRLAFFSPLHVSFCISCNELITLQRVSFHCSDLTEVREKYFHANSLIILARDIPLDPVFDLLKEINGLITSCNA